jgi:hypothetical protein
MKFMGKKRGYVDHFSNAVRSFENEIIKFETKNELESKNLLGRKTHDPNYLYKVDEIYFNTIKNKKKYSINN